MKTPGGKSLHRFGCFLCSMCSLLCVYMFHKYAYNMYVRMYLLLKLYLQCRRYYWFLLFSIVFVCYLFDHDFCSSDVRFFHFSFFSNFRFISSTLRIANLFRCNETHHWSRSHWFSLNSSISIYAQEKRKKFSKKIVWLSVKLSFCIEEAIWSTFSVQLSTNSSLNRKTISKLCTHVVSI